MTLFRALLLNNTFSFKLCPIADVFSIRETDFCSFPLTVLKVLIWEIFISPFYILHLYYVLSSTKIDVLKIFYQMFGIFFYFPYQRPSLYVFCMCLIVNFIFIFLPCSPIANDGFNTSYCLSNFLNMISESFTICAL